MYKRLSHLALSHTYCAYKAYEGYKRPGETPVKEGLAQTYKLYKVGLSYVINIFERSTYFGNKHGFLMGQNTYLL